MITGPGPFTAMHALLSLAALLSGVPVIVSLLHGSRSSRWVWVFWTTATATSVTGFFLPFYGMTPAIGVVAVVILAIVPTVARGAQRSRSGSCTFASEYLLVFVAIAQAFRKIPLLHAATPTLK